MPIIGDRAYSRTWIVMGSLAAGGQADLLIRGIITPLGVADLPRSRDISCSSARRP
jgi:hypothetical protein